MDKPRIFLGSSGQQAELVEALTGRLEEVAQVEPWTTVFNAGRNTLERLVELSHEVDFAAFVFAQDDWTAASSDAESGQASPRDNVVFEAGLFGGALGMRRSFILHANGAKLPTDLLGLTSIRYGDASSPEELATVNDKLRKAIEAEGRIARIVVARVEGRTIVDKVRPSRRGDLNVRVRPGAYTIEVRFLTRVAERDLAVGVTRTKESRFEVVAEFRR